ncbi:hypothetical protein NUW54_g553 [Trametes sanguinea]|uniref:Uncharacterized protein n=1 Tax=Trametes sanguinea TaxID=158606 RepID=A0ACC1QAB6_9APHY|nr:hypothetical protein NUW54_g553 [Trametes sanguinea]
MASISIIQRANGGPMAATLIRQHAHAAHTYPSPWTSRPAHCPFTFLFLLPVLLVSLLRLWRSRPSGDKASRIRRVKWPLRDQSFPWSRPERSVPGARVRPGDYGSKLLGERAGHVHLIVNGTKGKHRAMTTQAYVCPGNRSEHMMKDVANYTRKSRPINMATCYSIPAANGGEKYWELPELPADDAETASRVSWWNAKLQERGIDRQVLGVGRHELKLSTL